MNDGTIMYGEVIAADFAERDDGRIVVLVAVDADYSVAHRRVAVIDADYFEASLPTATEVEGIAS